MKTTALGNTADLSPAKDSPGLMVFKKSKRQAWFFTILFLLYVNDLVFGSLEFKFMPMHILAFIFLLIALVMGSKRHKIIFEISARTIHEETGFWPFAIKKRSRSFDKIKSIDLIEEIRSSFWKSGQLGGSQISCYIIKIIFQNQIEIGLNLFRDPAKGKEYLNYISNKINVASNDTLPPPFER